MAHETLTLAQLAGHDDFISRHNGPTDANVARMLATLGEESIATLIDRTVPTAIRLGRELDLEGPRTESEALDYLKRLARQNKVFKTYIGQGYHNTHLPAASSATCWKIRAGTPPIRRISRKLPRVVSKGCSTSSRR